MDATPANDLSDLQALPAEVGTEPPLVRPARPGPNIWMAIGWWLLLMVWQLCVGTVAVVAIGLMSVAMIGPNEFQSAMKETGAAALYDVPGATIILFLFATGGNLLLAAAIAAIMFRSKARRTLAIRGVSGVHLGLVVLMALPLAIAGGEAQTLAGKVLPQWHLNDAAYLKLDQQPWSIILLLGCMFPAMGEELFFRGFLGRGLVASHGAILGTFLTAALFGVTHVEPAQAVGTAVLALAFQGVYLSSKSLLAPMIFHALNNAMAFALLRLASNPTLRTVFGLEENSRISPLLFAAALLAVAGIGWMFYETRCRWVLSDGRLWEPGYVTAEMPPEHLMAVPRIRSPRTAGVIVALAAYLPFVIVLALEIAGN